MRGFKPMGGYVSPDTPAARIDARVKVALLVAWTVALFASPGALPLAAGAALLALCMGASRVTPASVARAARPVAFILAFTLAANLVSCDGRADVALVGAIGLDVDGGARGGFAVARILLLLGFSLALSASTTPFELSDALVRLMRPLARIGVPVSDIGSALSIALRFIPIVSEEFERTRLAQRARGVRLDEGGIVERLRTWASVFAPLIIGLFRRADRLADSMAARCYADGAAAAPEPLPLAMRDRAVLAVGLALISSIVVFSRMGL